jgi:4'-phosphopantetheinyl transferase
MASGIVCESTETIRLGKESVEAVVVRLAPESGSSRTAWDSLSKQERERADRYRRDRDRTVFVLARARLRELIAERLSIRPNEVEFRFGMNGKPSLTPEFAAGDLRFNVSHSGDVVAYAFSIGKEIGIDIEAIRDFPDADRVAMHAFSECERRSYYSLAGEKRAVGFFNCWTRKEAFVKALGLGLSCSPDRFDVSLEPEEPAEILRLDELPGHRCGWRIEAGPKIDGFATAIVIESGNGRRKEAPPRHSAAAGVQVP